MADKAFGVKDINLIGASGTPTIESPNNLNINAVNVAISTDITVAGKVSLGAGTSISSPAANKLTFGTSSQERLSIDSGGLVAIGKTDPSLYNANTNAFVIARGRTNDGITIDCSNQAGIFFSNGSNGAVDINGQLIYYHTPNDESMRMLVQGEKVRVNENGVVQIGHAAALGSDNGTRRLEVIGTDNTDAGFLLANNTTSASGTCDISFAPSNKITGAQIFCEAQEDFSTGANRTADLTFITRNDGTLSEKLRITSDGLIGLGTNDPAIPLDVHGADTNANGTGDVKGQLRVFNDTTAFGSSPRAGIVFSTKYRTSPDVPLDGAAIYGGKLNATDANKDFFLAFATRSESPNEAVERMRIEKTGPIASNPGSGDGDDFAAMALKNDWNAWIDIFRQSWIGGTSGWGTFWAGSTGAAYRRVSSDANPNEYVFIGSGQKRFTFDLDVGGNAFFDGSLAQNNYDYAEYFEWEDGNPNNEDRRGYSVFLNANGKIEKATSETSTSDIIGAISGTAAIIGDAAVYDWQGRYEIDEWGTRRKEQVTQVSWTDIDGTKHSYADENDVPSDVVVPDDASRRIHHRYIESSTYDSSQAYVPRDQRREWGIVGLLGKVRVRNDSPKHPNWKYIKTIAGKDLWLIK